jgi:hypothetical protein
MGWIGGQNKAILSNWQALNTVKLMIETAKRTSKAGYRRGFPLGQSQICKSCTKYFYSDLWWTFMIDNPVRDSLSGFVD